MTAVPPPAASLDRLAQIPPLGRGKHFDIDDGCCIMEAVSFVAGEPWSAYPECASPVIGTLLRSWNDALPDDERDPLLRPRILLLPGTRADADTERRRSLMAADWLIREHTPAWLRLAGFTAEADDLAALPETTDMVQCLSLQPVLEANRRAANCDVPGYGFAAWGVADDFVRATAGAAAVSSGGGVVRIAVREAALTSVAVLASAISAAEVDLTPTRLALQQSALRLVHRMIAAQVPA